LVPCSEVIHTFYIPSPSTHKKSKCRKKTKAKIKMTCDGSAQRPCKEVAAMQAGGRESAFIHSFPDPNIKPKHSAPYMPNLIGSKLSSWYIIIK